MIRQYRRRVGTVLPAMMLFVFITGLAISDFHSHRDCRDSDNCAMCTFQTATYTMSDESTPVVDPTDRPVLLSILIAAERSSEPFHISVFPSHAPPQFS